MFEPESVFRTLYRDVLYQVSKSRVMAFEGSRDVILRSGFISRVENRLRVFYEQAIRGGHLHQRSTGVISEALMIVGTASRAVPPVWLVCVADLSMAYHADISSAKTAF